MSDDTVEQNKPDGSPFGELWAEYDRAMEAWQNFDKNSFLQSDFKEIPKVNDHVAKELLQMNETDRERINELREEVGMISSDIAARNEVIRKLGSEYIDPMRFTDRSRKVINLSLREALQLGHNYVGTEHLLLALLAEGEGVGAKVLQSLGTPEEIRSKVISALGGFTK